MTLHGLNRKRVLGIPDEEQRAYNSINATSFVVSDNNGNVTELANCANGPVLAACEHPLCGIGIRKKGPAGVAISLRFSTKYRDGEPGFTYYGYRFYSPTLGRWLNRDPKEEEGGLNLYAFCGNDPVNKIDTDGRYPTTLAGWEKWGEWADRASLGNFYLGTAADYNESMDFLRTVMGRSLPRLPIGTGLQRVLNVATSGGIAWALDARFTAFSAVGEAAGRVMAGRDPSQGLNTEGLADSFLRNALRGDMDYASLDAALLGQSIGMDLYKDQFTTWKGALSLGMALMTRDAATIAAAMPSYTALNAWDSLEGMLPALEATR